MSDGKELRLVAFDPTTAADMLAKLRREIERFESTSERDLSRDHVTNAFWTAWHLHQWIWDAIKEQPELKAAVMQYRGIDQEGIEDHRAFGAALAARFVPLKICRLVATSSKHVQIALPTSEDSNDPAMALPPLGSAGGDLGGEMQYLSASALPPPENTPMVVIMGRPIAAARLLKEIEDYWVTLVRECGIEKLG